MDDDSIDGMVSLSIRNTYTQSTRSFFGIFVTRSVPVYFKKNIITKCAYFLKRNETNRTKNINLFIFVFVVVTASG